MTEIKVNNGTWTETDTLLPNKDGKYLVTDSENTYLRDYSVKEKSFGVYCFNGNFVKDDSVVAYIDIPKYTGKKKNDNNMSKIQLVSFVQ